MKKLWHDKAWEEYLDWLKRDKRAFYRLNLLLKDIDRNGYDCIGKPEPLRGDFTGWWSVRINQKDRLVFKLEEDKIVILQCRNHYKK